MVHSAGTGIAVKFKRGPRGGVTPLFNPQATFKVRRLGSLQILLSYVLTIALSARSTSRAGTRNGLRRACEGRAGEGR